MSTVRKPAATARKGGVREQSAQATRETLLKAAIKVFGKQGLNGARVEQISRAAKSHDRMIYYYFGSKEALFVAVIEETYRRFNEAEARLALDLSQPVQALRDVIAFMWGYYQKHPEFITLLNSEYSSPALEVLSRVLGSGVQAGLFRPELRARDVYLMIASMGYFYLSNRYTLSTFLGESLEDPAALAQWQQFITDAVLRTVLVTVPPATP